MKNLNKNVIFGFLIISIFVLSGCTKQIQPNKFTIKSIEISDIKAHASFQEIKDRGADCNEFKQTGKSEPWPNEAKACSGLGYQADIVIILNNYKDYSGTPLTCTFKIDDQVVHHRALDNGLNDDIYLIGKSVYPRHDRIHILEICCNPSWNEDWTKGLSSPERILNNLFVKCVTKTIEKVW